MGLPKLYFAGPLFTAAEQAWNADVVRELRRLGYEVFLPQEQEQLHASAPTIFMADITGIQAADLVVAVMDGPDPDSGTCWECGYAYGCGIPVILLRTDMREETPFGPFNLMLHQSADELVQCEPYREAGTIAHEINMAVTRKWHPSLRTTKMAQSVC